MPAIAGSPAFPILQNHIVGTTTVNTLIEKLHKEQSDFVFDHSCYMQKLSYHATVNHFKACNSFSKE